MFVFCDTCEASNPPDNAYCSNCGGSLPGSETTGAASDAPARPRSRAAAKRAADRAMADNRRAATRARRAAHAATAKPGKHKIAEVQVAIRRVQRVFLWLFVLNTLAAVLLGALLVIGRDRIPDVEFTIGVVGVVLGGIVAAIAGLGMLYGQRKPLPWSIGLAGILTVSTLLSLLTGSLPILDIILTVIAWGCLPAILRLEKWKREDPDNPAWERLAGRGEKRPARRPRKIDLRTPAIAAGVILLVGAAIYGIQFLPGFRGSSDVAASESEPDEPIEPTLLRFESAWADGDLEAIGELYAYRLAGRARRLPQRFEDHGIRTPFPALADRSIAERSAKARAVSYRIDQGIVEALFFHDGGAWRMTALRLPD
jgi:hypothetical protein